MVEKELMNNYKVFIPCAGVGERLGEFTENINKTIKSPSENDFFPQYPDFFHNIRNECMRTRGGRRQTHQETSEDV